MQLKYNCSNKFYIHTHCLKQYSEIHKICQFVTGNCDNDSEHLNIKRHFEIVNYVTMHKRNKFILWSKWSKLVRQFLTVLYFFWAFQSSLELEHEVWLVWSITWASRTSRLCVRIRGIRSFVTRITGRFILWLAGQFIVYQGNRLAWLGRWSAGFFGFRLGSKGGFFFFHFPSAGFRRRGFFFIPLPARELRGCQM